MALEGLVERVAGHFGLKTEEFESGSKVPVKAIASAVVCCMGIRKLGLTSVSIAKEQGISPSAVSKSISRVQQASWH